MNTGPHRGIASTEIRASRPERVELVSGRTGRGLLCDAPHAPLCYQTQVQMAETTAIRLGEARVLLRGEPGYEEARCAIWNARKPRRFPDLIAVATSDRDVVEAIRFAGSHGMRVAVRGGGHSMAGSPVRDRGMLIDLSRMRELSIDAASRTASVQPGVRSDEFAAALGGHGLAFPVGHDGSLPLSGYLLSGGFGWNVSMWDAACLSIRSVDVVTADGALVTADEHQYPDLYWAARGAGAGFFGVATRFRLSVHPLPRFIRMSSLRYPLAETTEVSRWADDLAPQLPPTVEMHLTLETAPPGIAAGSSGKVVGVLAVAFADSEEEAARSLSLMETCPARDRALIRATDIPATFAMLHGIVAKTMPEGHRYAEDTLWSNETAAVMSRLAEHIMTAPSERSFVNATMLRPPRTMPDAAFSMLARTFLWCCSIWESEADDARNEGWLRGMMRSVEPLGVGHYIAGADLLADPLRPVRSFAAPNWERLHALKSRHDPEGLFHSFLRGD